MVAYLFHDIHTASKMIEQYKALENYFKIGVHKIFFYFYNGLITSSVAEHFEEKQAFIEDITENIEMLTLYADNA